MSITEWYFVEMGLTNNVPHVYAMVTWHYQSFIFSRDYWGLFSRAATVVASLSRHFISMEKRRRSPLPRIAHVFLLPYIFINVYYLYVLIPSIWSVPYFVKTSSKALDPFSWRVGCIFSGHEKTHFSWQFLILGCCVFIDRL